MKTLKQIDEEFAARKAELQAAAAKARDEYLAAREAIKALAQEKKAAKAEVRAAKAQAKADKAAQQAWDKAYREAREEDKIYNASAKAKAKAEKASAAAAKAAKLEELAKRANEFKNKLAEEMRLDPSGQSEEAKAAGAAFNEAKAAYKAAR